MKKRTNIILFIAGTTGLLLTSCRSTDTENSLVNGEPTAVNFSLTGASFANQKSEPQASVDGTIVGSTVQKQSIMIDPSIVMVAELSPASDGRVSAQASVGGAMAAVPGNSLASGTQFRVIAYSRSNGSFQAYQDYTVGQQAVPMMLNVGASYTMVVYSYGGTKLPAITAGEQKDINSAQVNYDDTNRDFMYYNEGDYIPAKGSNVLNITLRHRVAQITTIINSNGMGDISTIKNGILTSHYSDGTIPLSNGVISGRSTLTAGVPLQFSNTSPTTSVAAPVFINADTGGNNTGSFSADITIGGKTLTKTLPNTFKITPGYKNNLTINIEKCGAMVNGVWRAFMCHNLGADTTADPFTPSQAIQGARYQWGVQTGTPRKYFTQAQDQDPQNAIPSSSLWDDNLNNVSPNGSWDNSAGGGPANPCPSGYRVPSSQEWGAVVAENSKKVVGTWSGIFGGPTYTAGLLFGDGLMLPAAGFRQKGMLQERGKSGYYWSNTPVGTTGPNDSESLQFFNGGSTVITGSFTGMTRYDGLSVRCIAVN